MGGRNSGRRSQAPRYASRAGQLVWQWIRHQGSWGAAAEASGVSVWSLRRLVGSLDAESVTVADAIAWRARCGIQLEAWAQRPTPEPEKSGNRLATKRGDRV